MPHSRMDTPFWDYFLIFMTVVFLHFYVLLQDRIFFMCWGIRGTNQKQPSPPHIARKDANHCTHCRCGEMADSTIWWNPWMSMD